MIKQFIEFITHDIWSKKEDEYKSKYIRWIVRQVKAVLLAGKGFGEHGLLIRASALTFYTLMSLVPVAALIFAVVKGFGLQASFSDYLYLNYPQYSDIIDQVFVFADNLLARTKGGLIAAVGIVVLFWALMRVFGNIESAFNYIWEIKKERSLARKFSDYLTIVFISPLLWILSNSFTIYLETNISAYNNGFFDFIYGAASFVAMWVMFTFIYFVMPNTKVKLVNAFKAGIIAGSIFEIFQITYMFIQTEVSSYNAIYGSFAALPLFLIWLQFSWQILLSGAELSFAYQNISKYEQERMVVNMSNYTHTKILLASMIVLTRHFVNNCGGVTSEDIAKELNQPLRIIRDVLYDLECTGLIVSVNNDKENTYLPAMDVHTLRVCDILKRVNTYGTVSIDEDENGSLKRVESLLNQMQQSIDKSSLNTPITDLI